MLRIRGTRCIALAPPPHTVSWGCTITPVVPTIRGKPDQRIDRRHHLDISIGAVNGDRGFSRWAVLANGPFFLLGRDSVCRGSRLRRGSCDSQNPTLAFRAPPVAASCPRADRGKQVAAISRRGSIRRTSPGKRKPDSPRSSFASSTA